MIMHVLLPVAISTERTQVDARIVRLDAVDMVDMQQVPVFEQIHTAFIAIETNATPYLSGDLRPCLLYTSPSPRD